MERGTSSQGSGVTPSTAYATAISPLLLLVAGSLSADTSVYRCDTPDGVIEFSQLPCAEGANEQEIFIQDRKTGWVPNDTPSRRTTKKTGKPRNRKRKPAGADRAAAQARREERCWKKRQLLEGVNRKLRRGYKAGQGVKLRDRRRDFEAYIRKFCTRQR